MSAADAWAIGWGFIQGFATSSLFILALFVLVMVAQWLGKRFGVKE